MATTTETTSTSISQVVKIEISQTVAGQIIVPVVPSVLPGLFFVH